MRVTTSRGLGLILSGAFLLWTTTTPAQQPTTAKPTNDQSKDAPKPAKTKADEPAKTEDKPKSTTDETLVVTRHQSKVAGKELSYTATTGLMPIRDAKGETEAHIFFMAYKLDDAGPSAKRPLLFSFNGGPGSASVWLHMGALGPRRVALPDTPTIAPPPFQLVENESSWLDQADLVFIDPIGTGLSRAAKPELNAKFHSLNGDIASVGEFIRLYLTRYERWNSPLYLIGESYGTTRAAGLAGHLIDEGIAFSGIALVSCALDFQAFVFNPGNDLPFPTYLPSYTASAWYHKKLPADLQAKPLPAVLAEVEQFCDRDYAAILARGDQLSATEISATAGRLARYTGLAASDIEDHHLRIDMSHFTGVLLKDQKRSMGRFDARYLGIESTAVSDRPTFDPSLAAVRAPYTSTFNQYLRSTLNYKSDAPYYILGGGVGRWDWQRDMGYPATTRELRDAMTKNPHMKVLIASGYYDLATPYRAVEHSLAGLGLDPILRKNITIAKYEAGHMMYLDPPSLRKLKQDGTALIDGARAK